MTKPIEITERDIAKFWTYVDRREPDECWPWTGIVSRSKRGVFWTHGGRNKRRNLTASHVALGLANRPTNGQHKFSCKNTLCCNPQHIYSNYAPLIEIDPASGYTPTQRNSFSLSTEFDAFIGTLSPLRSGKSVSLLMEDPRYSKLKNYSGTKGKQLVLLVPGSLLQMDTSKVLIAIVGSGSVIVDPLSSKVANLVLAGMPAKLAGALMHKLRRLYQES